MSTSHYKWIFVFITAFTLIGCNSNKDVRMQAFKYHENAKRKPVVAMLPVINKADNYLPWDLAEEFTAEIQKRLIHKSVIYLNTVDVPKKLGSKLEGGDAVVLSKEDFSELAGQNDFVVLMELLEHSEVPFSQAHMDADLSDQTIDRILNIKMRVKVVDLRGQTLKTILQEIIPLDHLIPRDYSHVDYERVIWGSDAYPATAYGRAHARLERTLAKQIENYISIAH